MESGFSNSRTGFTLVEMAIVLTIIGLVVAGILVGKSLIRNAELQAIVSEVNRLTQAAKQFRDKYKYLPGDFPNAATFWGADTGCSSAGVPNSDNTPANATPKRNTCGGDGDGFVAGSTSTYYSIPDRLNPETYREALRAWQHLANAGFIEGSYTGAPFDDGTHGWRASINLPSADVNDGSGLILFHSVFIGASHTTPDGVANIGLFPGPYGHVLQYGQPKATTDAFGGLAPAITADDAAMIDRKVDDGLAGTGNVIANRAFDDSVPGCSVVDDDPAHARYDTSSKAITCTLFFITGL